jgi:hypothetical protein
LRRHSLLWFYVPIHLATAISQYGICEYGYAAIAEYFAIYPCESEGGGDAL